MKYTNEELAKSKTKREEMKKILTKEIGESMDEQEEVRHSYNTYAPSAKTAHRFFLQEEPRLYKTRILSELEETPESNLLNVLECTKESIAARKALLETSEHEYGFLHGYDYCAANLLITFARVLKNLGLIKSNEEEEIE